jgi:hypothetical protein
VVFIRGEIKLGGERMMLKKGSGKSKTDVSIVTAVVTCYALAALQLHFTCSRLASAQTRQNWA